MTNNEGSLELNWINKNKSLLYEIVDEDGKGYKPIWVERTDIRVSEPRIFRLKDEIGDPASNNILIKGDNLLALKTLIEIFKDYSEEQKVKCIYIDPPFNTGAAFEYYDDNLERSQWLTMMRDRLLLLKQLLREDGAIFIHIDYQQIAYLNVLMDEIFGRNNFVQLISIKAASPAGFKTVNPGPVDVTEYILFYTKNKSKYNFKRLYVPILYDPNYNLLITNIEEPPENWEFEKIKSAIYKREKIPDWDNPKIAWRHAKKKWGSNYNIIVESLIADYALENAHRLVSIRDPHKPTNALREKLEESKNNPDKVFVIERDGYNPLYLYKGGSLAFYENKIKTVNGKQTATELLTDFWADLSWAGIAREGGVRFKNGKKPERLIKRIIEMSTEPGDLVLDSFSGSGTTASVAHKMNRKWIAIELGKQAETLCKKRLSDVINTSSPDKSGISKDDDINWIGGGGFRYYITGDSVLSKNDMNWEMTFEELAEAVFINFGFNTTQNISSNILVDDVFVGCGRRKGQYAICSLTKDIDIINNEQLNKWLIALKERFGNWQEVDVYTNKGVGIRVDNLPNGVILKKIPETLLEKYNL